MRVRRAAIRTLIAVLGVAVIAWLGIGWYFSSQVIALPGAAVDHADTLVVSVAGDGPARLITIRAPATSPSRQTVVGGLILPGGGFIQLGAIASTSSDTTTRRGRLLIGAWPAAGTRLTSTSYGWPADPKVTLGTTVTNVLIPGPVGRLPAWQVTGRKSTWLVFVHGRGTTRREALNIMRVGHQLGYPELAIEYRGAPQGPHAPDGHQHFGQTEWHDLQAALDYLKTSQHATHVVLVGYSLGGGIVAQFLRHSPDRSLVAGAILDAPLLDVDATLALRAGEDGLPSLLVRPVLLPTEMFSSLRGGLDFEALDTVHWLADTTDPILLIQGSQDTSVAIGSSRALARLGHTHVTYDECRAEHVRCWNADPTSYEAAVTTFLAANARS